MKRFFLCLSTALLTLVIGLFINSVFLFLTQIPNIEVIDKAAGINPKPINGIKIEYKWTLTSKYKNTGYFVVTNNKNESIYYLAYEKNEHFDNWIKQNGKVEAATSFICRMGMKEQELKPNESALFDISVPHNKKSFEAGFDFFIGNKQDSETFWVKVDKQLRYSAISSEK